MRRYYKSGMRWCFWRWTETPQSGDYITRLHLVKTPWFAICLHWINRADPEPYLHDHPVSFLSIVLKGGYTEFRQDPERVDGFTLIHHVRWWNFITGARWDCHSIIDVWGPTLTLCFMGPKRREWGYHVGSDWVGWKYYYARKEQVNAV